jgi:adenosylhomocysteine nucleosidase
VSRVLVLTAVELEARTLARELGLDRVAGDELLRFRGGAVEVACVGLGGCRLAALGDRWTARTLVVSAGTCGALAPDLASGALVVPEAVMTPGGGRYAPHAVPGVDRGGRLLSVTEVVETAEAKARLWLDTGALAVDMESAEILRWAGSRGLHAAVVRGVSDTATEAVPRALRASVDGDGRLRTSRALRAVLARPATLGQAMVLRRGTTAALATVAATLARVARSLAGRDH